MFGQSRNLVYDFTLHPLQILITQKWTTRQIPPIVVYLSYRLHFSLLYRLSQASVIALDPISIGRDINLLRDRIKISFFRESFFFLFFVNLIPIPSREREKLGTICRHISNIFHRALHKIHSTD